MAQPQILNQAHTVSSPAPQVDYWLLNYLRVQAARQRCASKLDLFQACSLLISENSAATDAYTTALVRTLPQALDRCVSFYAPDKSDLSFDEAWLLQLLTSIRTGDEDSLTFLLNSRMTQHKRRAVLYLLRAIVNHWDDII